MTELLNVRRLSIAYGPGNPVVENVTFAVLPGESIALVGPSGSGKSSCAGAVLGLLPRNLSRVGGEALFDRKEGGSIDLLQASSRELRAIRGREIGMIFQEPTAALNPVMNCGQQLREAIRRYGYRKGEEESYLQTLLEQVELGDLRGRLMKAMPSQLSGGQLQRLLLAMALAGQPRLLIADEPTTALDCITEAEIVRLLDRLRRERQMGLIFITHDPDLVRRVTDRTVRLGVPPSHPSAVFVRGTAGEKHVSNPKRATPPMLTVRDLRIRFTDTVDDNDVVQACSFHLHRGEWIGLIGRSGCGKSTVAAWLGGLQPATEGTLQVQDDSIPAAAEPARVRAVARTQLIFQDVYGSLNPAMSVRNIVREALTERSTERANALLDAVGLGSDRYGDMRVHQLSGGERQRVAIARALASDPRVLICDEVLSGLDRPLRGEVVAVLKRVCAERGIGVILITHDLELAHKATDRLLLMENGRIVEEGAVEEILTCPRSDVGRSLVEALRLRQQ